MKNVWLAALFALLTFGAVQAQDCEAYFPMEAGTVFEITNYDAKEKKTGKTIHEVISVDGSGSEMTIKAKNTSYDKKDKEVATTEYEVVCKDGKFYLDMTAFMQNETMESNQNMEVTVDGDKLEFPSNPTAGQTLPDAKLTISMGPSGPVQMKMNIDVTDRKVEALETIETPAGSFDCVKMSQTTSTKMVIPIKTTSVDWYAKEIGMVRSEMYNKKGKLTGVSVLTSLTKK